MLKEAFLTIFERDLRTLKNEIGLYRNEADLWVVKPGISNSAGNLCLHLIGNLKHFVGAVLGQTGYVREREREFSDKNVPRETLLASIDETIEVVKKALGDLPDDMFDQNFPVEKRGETVKTDFMLLHLFGHFSYHLGQINYHRRLIS
ncbi:MAG: DUF1572 family protein [Saprospiraceae bacterium]|nr:DUF1572 family protein [Saprospiraceae bacterium]